MVPIKQIIDNKRYLEKLYQNRPKLNKVNLYAKLSDSSRKSSPRSPWSPWVSRTSVPKKN